MMFDDLGMKIILHEETALGYIYIYICINGRFVR